MRQYLDAVREILASGTRKPNRTGVDTLSTFGVFYEIDLREGFPLLTTKAMSWKNIVVEMLWFISGRTDIGILKKHGCKFWDAWADERGEVPSAYGNFWRHFPVHSTESIDGYAHPPSVAFNDQLAWVVEELKRNPMSRRCVVSAWAPGNAQTSKLPPCHAMFVLNVQLVEDCCYGMIREGNQHDEDCTRPGPQPRLCLHLTQRSCDIALGVPYNIASYALLLHLISRFTGIPVGVFAHTLVDAHAYTCKADGSQVEHDHVPGLREQLRREPRRLPKLAISDEIQTLADVEKLLDADTDEVMRHFALEGYREHRERVEHVEPAGRLHVRAPAARDAPQRRSAPGARGWFVREGERESVGRQSAKKIIRILEGDLDDPKHEAKVAGYVARHLAQRPAGDVRGTRWRYSLMNWGHDPTKRGRR